MDIRTYDHFIFELLHPPGELELCSLRVGGHDLGPWLRFTPPQPVRGFDGYYRTVQVRNFPLRLQSSLLGWHARQVWINPQDASCRPGKWKPVRPDEGFDFSRLPRPGLFAGGRPLAVLGNPPDPVRDGWYDIDFDADVLHWNDYDETDVLLWAETGYIEMGKHGKQNNTSERPSLYLNFGERSGRQERIAAPLSAEAPLYIFLSQHFDITLAAIEEVLSSRRNCARTLWTCLPMLELGQPAQLDSRVMARDLQTWLLSTRGEPLRMGAFQITGAMVYCNEEPFGRFPSRSIGFRFSGINGKPDKPDVVAAFEHARLASGEPEFELRPDWSTFFEWHGHDLDIHLNFETGGHGHGSIGLSTLAYQNWLHACFPDPGASRPTQLLTPDFIVSYMNYSPNDAQRVFPRPDSHNDDRRVTFWRDGTWQGFSEGPWSVRWQAGEIAEFKVLVEDEMRDRGGPYDYLAIVLTDGSRFGIRSGSGTIDAGCISNFLSQ
ncbi:hypothetical protein ACQFN5_29565 (plasmid) [Klebsiella sp. WOUb02]|uniref:hypothetical protein n=1 Tax=Klebsiella sp. WOUb02 TaxID=3161071 RepID=UPI003CE6E4C4